MRGLELGEVHRDSLLVLNAVYGNHPKERDWPERLGKLLRDWEEVYRLYHSTAKSKQEAMDMVPLASSFIFGNKIGRISPRFLKGHQAMTLWTCSALLLRMLPMGQHE
jgi:hypothetical protein